MATEKRLIDANELMKFPIRINHYDKVNGNEHFVLGIESVLEYAENLPTVDAVEVVHGRWEFDHTTVAEKYDVVKCSNCGHEAFAIAIYVKEGHYCPNCGAKMDGGKDNATDQP